MRTQPRGIYGFVPRRESRAPTIARCILAAVVIAVIGALTWPG